MHTEVLHGVSTNDGLCFQLCQWHWDDAEPGEGYRFIWRDEEGRLLPQRGQAFIPQGAVMLELIARALRAGWLR